ncbi:MAG: hypothetical protein ABSA11_09190 [Candidatus Bathyarchaeia archaeon]
MVGQTVGGRDPNCQDKVILTDLEFRDKPDGMRNVFRRDHEGVAGGLGPPRAWSKRDP